MQCDHIVIHMPQGNNSNGISVSLLYSCCRRKVHAARWRFNVLNGHDLEAIEKSKHKNQNTVKNELFFHDR